MPSTASPRDEHRRIAAAIAGAAFVFCAAASGGESSDDNAADARSEIERLRAEVAELTRSCEELGRRLEAVRAPTRAAVEDYLEARGVTGLAWTDRDLTPLDQTLRRGTLGAEFRARYEFWENLVDLDDAADDKVDFSEALARVAFGFAFVEGPEIDLELQGLLRQGGILAGPALSGGNVVPPPIGTPGRDPVLALDGLDPDEELVFRRAEVRMPAFNLGGRLVHVPVMLSAGRQEIAFGRGFFLGDDDAGGGITWDALRVWGESGEGGRVDVFGGRAAVGSRVVAAHIAGPVDPDTADPDIGIIGVRGETRGLLPDSMLAAYYVRTDLGAVGATALNYTSIPSGTVHTFGLEAGVELTTTARMRFDGALQWGDLGAQEIKDSGAAALEFEFGGDASRGRGSVYAAYGTGDRAISASAYEAFMPIAQDRMLWDDIGLLSSRNTALWGFRMSTRSARQTEAGVRFTQVFAPREESPAGFFLRGSSAGTGHRIGELVSIFVDWQLFDQEGSHFRVAWAYFNPGDWFSDASGANQFRLMTRFGF